MGLNFISHWREFTMNILRETISKDIDYQYL